MDRAAIEKLSINQLRTLASQLNLGVKGARPVILDRILDFYDRNGWPGQFSMEQLNSGDESEVNDGAEGPKTEGHSSRWQPTTAKREGSFGVQNINMQEVVQAVVQVMEERQRVLSGPGAPPPIPRGGSAASTEPSTSANNWHQIKFATKLIPTFAGKEEENVVRWLERIAGVARMYNLGDDIIVLAAVSQLMGRALEWYNRQPLETVASWEEFKFQIRRYFEVKESYTATLARIGRRIWKSQTEKFIDYAEDKLSLMQSLSLTEKEKIDLLSDGVKDPILRKLVLSTWLTNVPDFLEHVRRITEDTTSPKREWSARIEGQGRFQNKGNDTRQISTEAICYNCKQTGHLARNCQQQRKMTCFKCGQEGHISLSCPKKGAGTGVSASHVIEQQENAAEDGAATPTTLHINKVDGDEQDKAYISVRSLSNTNIGLEALIDTGSPVSLIRYSVYKKYFAFKELFKIKGTTSLKGVNGSVINIFGKIHDQIILEMIPESWFDIELFVVDDNTMRFDLLLGRKFFSTSKLKLTYQQGNFSLESTKESEEFIHSILAIC